MIGTSFYKISTNIDLPKEWIYLSQNASFLLAVWDFYLRRVLFTEIRIYQQLKHTAVLNSWKWSVKYPTSSVMQK